MVAGRFFVLCVFGLGSLGCYAHAEPPDEPQAPGQIKAPATPQTSEPAAASTATPSDERDEVAAAGAGKDSSGGSASDDEGDVKAKPIDPARTPVGVAGAEPPRADMAGAAAPSEVPDPGREDPPDPSSADLDATDGRGTDILDCDVAAGYRVIRYTTEYEADPEVHVLGVYESRNRSGEALVKVTRDVPIALVLSAYEPTHWTVVASADAQIATVVLNGHSKQTITIAAGSEILDYSDYASGKPTLTDCGYGDDGGGCNTTALLAAAQRVLGQPVSAFAGCYSASTFVVGNER